MRFLNNISYAALALALGTPVAVAAQDNGAADASADDGVGINDIVVTAQRREQRLQSVPIPVSAVSGDDLEKTGITDMRQLTQTMPGLVFSRANSSLQPYIRGVGTRNSNVGDESNVAIYIDGVYQPVMSSLGFDLVNIERVEVLRGPQGTLFGRNSTGGLINVITKDPTEEFSGKISVTAGSYDQFSGSAYVSSGLAEGVKVDATYMRYTDSGYIKDLVNGGHAGPRDSQVVRGRIFFEPVDRFKASLTGTHTWLRDGSPVTNQPYLGNTFANTISPLPLYGTKPWESAQERPLLVKSRLWSAELQMKYEFDGFNIETTSAYQDATALSQTDNDGSAAAIRGADVYQTLHYFSNELRLLSTTSGPFSWIAGAYLFDGSGEFDPLISIVNGTPGGPFHTKQTVNSYALFGEATLEVGKFSLTGGIRYTDESRDYYAESSTNPLLVPLQEGSNDKVTFRATAQYTFSPDLNAYLTFSRGFKSGVFNGFATNLTAAQITKPETLDAFEFGIKSDPLPWLRANLSLFLYDYKDIQQSARDPSSSLIILFNAAKSKMKGGEFEVTMQPTRDFNLRFYGAYLDAKYDSFPGAQVFVPITTCPIPGQSPCGNAAVAPFDASGNDMIRAPEITLGGSGSYQIPVDFGLFSLSTNVYYSDKYYWDFDNRIVQPSYTMVNGEIAFATSDSSDAFRISVWGKNLLNEVVYQQVLNSTSGDVVAFERPRTFGVTLSKGF
jgi:iron complex outermembrane recepter protein